MQLPNVPNVVRDEERNITYTVLAYRRLTRDECLMAISQANRTKTGKPKRPKPNTKVEITTIIGFNE